MYICNMETNRQKKCMVKKDLFCYAEREMKQLADIRKASTVRNYMTALNALAQYLGRRSLPLDDIDRQLMQDFEQWLQHHGKCRNTSSAYLRSLKALFNRAVDAGLTAERNPFRRVFTGNAHTVKRGLSRSEFKRLLACDMSNDRQRVAVDVFLFSVTVCGMPFVDVAHLRWSQIKDGRLFYHRRKTGECLSVLLEPEAKEILRRYKGGGANGYVFPLLAEADDEKAYRNALSRYNRCLRRWGQKAGLQRHLTSYVARHTWASQANENDIPISVISQGLTHTNLRTTTNYIASLSTFRLDHSNHQLIRLLFRMERGPSAPPKGHKIMHSSYKEDCII